MTKSESIVEIDNIIIRMKEAIQDLENLKSFTTEFDVNEVCVKESDKKPIAKFYDYPLANTYLFYNDFDIYTKTVPKQ